MCTGAGCDNVLFSDWYYYGTVQVNLFAINLPWYWVVSACERIHGIAFRVDLDRRDLGDGCGLERRQDKVQQLSPRFALSPASQLRCWPTKVKKLAPAAVVVLIATRRLFTGTLPGTIHISSYARVVFARRPKIAF